MAVRLGWWATGFDGASPAKKVLPRSWPAAVPAPQWKKMVALRRRTNARARQSRIFSTTDARRCTQIQLLICVHLRASVGDFPCSPTVRPNVGVYFHGRTRSTTEGHGEARHGASRVAPADQSARTDGGRSRLLGPYSACPAAICYGAVHPRFSVVLHVLTMKIEPPRPVGRSDCNKESTTDSHRYTQIQSLIGVHLCESVVENASSVRRARLCGGAEPSFSPIVVRARHPGKSLACPRTVSGHQPRWTVMTRGVQ
jgi:hypothetical protein